MHTHGVFAGRGRPRRDHRDLPLPRLGVRREKRRGASGSRQEGARNLRNACGGWQSGGRGLMTETFVIVGAGLAGGGAAATLREEGFDGRVVLIGAESQPPYERPPLSKEYLRGEFPFEQTLVQPPDFYGENDIETRFSARVTRVDAAGKAIELDNAESVSYEALLLATGASRSQDSTLRASMTCARLLTPTRSAQRVLRGKGRWWWGWALSAQRW